MSKFRWTDFKGDYLIGLCLKPPIDFSDIHASTVCWSRWVDGKPTHFWPQKTCTIAGCVLPLIESKSFIYMSLLDGPIYVTWGAEVTLTINFRPPDDGRRGRPAPLPVTPNTPVLEPV